MTTGEEIKGTETKMFVYVINKANTLYINNCSRNWYGDTGYKEGKGVDIHSLLRTLEPCL